MRDQWIMILAEEVEIEGRLKDDICRQECVLNIFGLRCEEHDELVELFDNNPLCLYEDTRDGRLVLRARRDSQEEVLKQLASRGYNQIGEDVERSLLPCAEQKAWVYHLAREEVDPESIDEDITSKCRAEETKRRKEDGNLEKSDTESESEMSECRVTKKDDRVTLIQVIVKKGLK